MIDLRRDEIQSQAVQAWFDNGCNGTIELHTGLGKTFCVFKSLQQLPQITNVLFLAETSIREQNVKADMIQFKKFFNHDPSLLRWKYACYQGAYKYKITDYFPNATYTNTLIVLDEIHDLFTDKYIEFLTNQPDIQSYMKLGLTATLDGKTKYIIQGEEITKKDICDRWVPSVYKYGMMDAIQDGTSRQNLRFFVLEHNLDNTINNIKSGTAAKPFYQNELSKYIYLDQTFNKMRFLPASNNKDFLVRNAASARAKFLYQLPSKEVAIRKILPKLRGKTLIFGKDNPTLMNICPNAIVSNNPSYKQDLENFINGKTLVTASNKMLKQGANIPHLDNIILHSYYGKETDFVQMVGRLRKSNQPGNVIIFATQNTQETRWLKTIMEDINIKTINTNLTQLLNLL